MPIPKSTSAAEQAEALRQLGYGDDGDDGGDTEIDSKRQPRRSNERRPRTVTELDTAAIYNRFNNPPKSKTDADED